MTSSHDLKLEDVISGYKAAHKITPTELAERFLRYGSSLTFVKVLNSIPKLLPDEKIKFKAFLNKVMQDEKYPADEKTSVMKGTARASLLLYYCYSSLFSDNHPKRFDTFLDELVKIEFPLALTFAGLNEVDTVKNATGIAHLKRAALLKCTHAMEHLGHIYWTNLYGEQANYSLAMQYLEKAMEQGSMEAYFTVALLIFNKQMRLKERSQEKLDVVVHHLKFAAMHGHTAALIQLAQLFRLGIGVPRDREVAFKLYDAVREFANPNYTPAKQFQTAKDGASRCIFQQLPWLWAVPAPDDRANPNQLPAIELRALKPLPGPK